MLNENLHTVIKVYEDTIKKQSDSILALTSERDKWMLAYSELEKVINKFLDKQFPK